MKLLISASILLCAFAIPAVSQITITQSDMPQGGDTLRVSMTADSIGLPKPALTGKGITWDYSALVYTSQTIDTFLTVSSTPITYQLYFNDPLYPSFKSTVAQAGANLSLGFVTITKMINYYKDESSNFESVGYGAEADALPVSVKDDTIDVIYKFPMNYADADSCHSGSHASIPLIGYYIQKQYRVNHVEGWGKLITPYGTFSTLKVKTMLYTTDSAYLDTLHLGFRLPPTTQIQYKWLANGQHIPVLQINETVGSRTRQYIYRDSTRKSLLGINEVNSSLNEVSLYPNPAKENTTLSYSLLNTSTVTIAIYSVDGRCVSKVFKGQQTMGNHSLTMSVGNLSPGIYLLAIEANGTQSVKKLVVVK